MGTRLRTFATGSNHNVDAFPTYTHSPVDLNGVASCGKCSTKFLHILTEQQKVAYINKVTQYFGDFPKQFQVPYMSSIRERKNPRRDRSHTSVVVTPLSQMMHPVRFFLQNQAKLTWDHVSCTLQLCPKHRLSPHQIERVRICINPLIDENAPSAYLHPPVVGVNTRRARCSFEKTVSEDRVTGVQTLCFNFLEMNTLNFDEAQGVKIVMTRNVPFGLFFEFRTGGKKVQRKLIQAVTFHKRTRPGETLPTHPPLARSKRLQKQYKNEFNSPGETVRITAKMSARQKTKTQKKRQRKVVVEPVTPDVTSESEEEEFSEVMPSDSDTSSDASWNADGTPRKLSSNSKLVYPSVRNLTPTLDLESPRPPASSLVNSSPSAKRGLAFMTARDQNMSSDDHTVRKKIKLMKECEEEQVGKLKLMRQDTLTQPLTPRASPVYTSSIMYPAQLPELFVQVGLPPLDISDFSSDAEMVPSGDTYPLVTSPVCALRRTHSADDPLALRDVWGNVLRRQDSDSWASR